jgi:hypothetical protein
MDFDDIVFWAVLISHGLCFLLAIVVIFQKKLPTIHRLFPVVWQILFFEMFFGLTHGFPSEMFGIFVFTIFWSVLALTSSYRLNLQPALLAKLLAFFQFVEASCAIWGAALHYISASWNYYGRIVWNP